MLVVSSAVWHFLHGKAICAGAFDAREKCNRVECEFSQIETKIDETHIDFHGAFGFHVTHATCKAKARQSCSSQCWLPKSMQPQVIKCTKGNYFNCFSKLLGLVCLFSIFYFFYFSFTNTCARGLALFICEWFLPFIGNWIFVAIEQKAYIDDINDDDDGF